MTEKTIREIAEKHGLDVLKRITTGTAQAGFCTFELSGKPADVASAWREVHDAASASELRGGFVYCRASDADFQPYIGIESVYHSELQLAETERPTSKPAL